MAQGCRRLVKLKLSGCEGSYDGIKAIGQCCQMLEELTLSGHKMDGGWLSGLSYCSNLKTLKLQSCEDIDSCPSPDEHLGSCPTLDELYLVRCQMRHKDSAKALFLVCQSVREITFQDCWGLEDEIFCFETFCRWVLLEVLDKISPGYVNWKHATRPPIKMPFRKVENCNQVIDIGRQLKFSLINVAGNDIVQGNTKLILGIFFAMFAFLLSYEVYVAWILLLVLCFTWILSLPNWNS